MNSTDVDEVWYDVRFPLRLVRDGEPLPSGLRHQTRRSAELMNELLKGATAFLLHERGLFPHEMCTRRGVGVITLLAHSRDVFRTGIEGDFGTSRVRVYGRWLVPPDSVGGGGRAA